MWVWFWQFLIVLLMLLTSMYRLILQVSPLSAIPKGWQISLPIWDSRRTPIRKIVNLHLRDWRLTNVQSDIVIVIVRRSTHLGIAIFFVNLHLVIFCWVIPLHVDESRERFLFPVSSKFSEIYYRDNVYYLIYIIYII